MHAQSSPIVKYLPTRSLLHYSSQLVMKYQNMLPYLLSFLRSGFRLNPSYTSGLLHLLLLRFLLLQRLSLHSGMSGFLLSPPDRLESLRMLQMQRHLLSDNMLPHFPRIPHLLNHLLRYYQIIIINPSSNNLYVLNFKFVCKIHVTISSINIGIYHFLHNYICP